MNKLTCMLVIAGCALYAGSAVAALQAANDLPSASSSQVPIAPVDDKSTQHKAEGSKPKKPAVRQSEADAIMEKYGKWTFDCRRYEAGSRCSINQKLGNQLGIEVLQPEANETIKALILLPFGLAVSEGVTLSIDDKPADRRIPFSTCASEGCIVPMVVSNTSMEQILQANQLKIISFDAISLERKEYSIPLEGLSRAYLRLKNYR